MLGTKVTVRDDFDLVFIALDRSLLAMTRNITEGIKELASAAAPVETGMMSADIVSLTLGRAEGKVLTRTSAVAQSAALGRTRKPPDYPYAAYQEFGTVNNKAALFMTGAADAVASDLEVPILEAFDREFTL